MSISAMADVFELDVPPMQKLVLIAMADNTGPDGTIYPGIRSIMRKTSLSERTIQKVLKEMQAAELITLLDEPSRYGTRMWRLNMVDVPKRPKPSRVKQCPPKLRAVVVNAFAMRCEYCHKEGDELNGPDGRAWHIDRVVPGARGGEYVPDNVTLSCGPCNSRKRTNEAVAGTRTLATLRGGAEHAPPPAEPAPQGGAERAPKPSEEQPLEKPLQEDENELQAPVTGLDDADAAPIASHHSPPASRARLNGSKENENPHLSNQVIRRKMLKAGAREWDMDRVIGAENPTMAFYAWEADRTLPDKVKPDKPPKARTPTDLLDALERMKK